VYIPGKGHCRLANLVWSSLGFELKEALLHVEAFSQFATVTSMLLSANTLANLEIYRNQTDYSVKGSLLWLMDHTKTKMGKRMLRDWIGRPLVNVAMLEERLEAIAELKDDNTLTLEKMKGLLKGQMPDLGRGLSRIQYCRVSLVYTRRMMASSDICKSRLLLERLCLYS
jgi:DNA mismatch repair protein MSH3